MTKLEVEGIVRIFDTGYYGDFPNFTDARSSETDRLLQAFKGFEGMNVRVTIEELQELP